MNPFIQKYLEELAAQFAWVLPLINGIGRALLGIKEFFVNTFTFLVTDWPAAVAAGFVALVVAWLFAGYTEEVLKSAKRRSNWLFFPLLVLFYLGPVLLEVAAIIVFGGLPRWAAYAIALTVNAFSIIWHWNNKPKLPFTGYFAKRAEARRVREAAILERENAMKAALQYEAVVLVDVDVFDSIVHGDNKVLRTLKAGEIVSVFEKNGEWARISFDGQSEWVWIDGNLQTV